MTRSNLKQTSWESINLSGDNLDNNVAALNKVLKGFIAHQEKKKNRPTFASCPLFSQSVTVG